MTNIESCPEEILSLPKLECQDLPDSEANNPNFTENTQQASVPEETAYLMDGRDDLPMYLHWQLDDIPMSSAARSVYMHLVRCAGKKQFAFPGYAHIGRKCFSADYPTSPETTLRIKAIDAIKELEWFGLIIKQKRKFASKGDYTSNLYILTPMRSWNQQRIRLYYPEVSSNISKGRPSRRKGAELLDNDENQEVVTGDNYLVTGDNYLVTGDNYPPSPEILEAASLELDLRLTEVNQYNDSLSKNILNLNKKDRTNNSGEKPIKPAKDKESINPSDLPGVDIDDDDIAFRAKLATHGAALREAIMRKHQEHNYAWLKRWNYSEKAAEFFATPHDFLVDFYWEQNRNSLRDKAHARAVLSRPGQWEFTDDVYKNYLDHKAREQAVQETIAQARNENDSSPSATKSLVPMPVVGQAQNEMPADVASHQTEEAVIARLQLANNPELKFHNSYKAFSVALTQVHGIKMLPIIQKWVNQHSDRVRLETEADGSYRLVLVNDPEF